MSSAPAFNIPGYELIRELGVGGMATVFKAYDASTDRYVALKTLPEQYSKDPQFVERFRREIAPQLDASELRVEPLLVIDEEHRIPPALWQKLRDQFAACSAGRSYDQ